MRKSLTLQQKIIYFAQNNVVLIFIWLLLVTTSSLITLLSGVKLLNDTYSETFGYKEKIYSKLSLLNTRVNISYFITLLGQPIIIKSTGEKRDKKEYIFINKLYYVDAITDKDGQVASFAVTSRDRDFRPTFNISSSVYRDKLSVIKVTLNKSVFAEIDAITNCYITIAPRTWIYAEGKYLAGESEYQSAFVSLNSAGYMEPEYKHSLYPAELKYANGQNEDCKNASQQFRTEAKINTFMLTTDPDFSLATKDPQLPIVGVHPQDVNLINEK